jgi:hypothetical protein
MPTGGGPTQSFLSLVAANERRATRNRRALHDDETGALKMVDPLRYDPRHRLGGVMLSLPTLESQRERERVDEVFGRTPVAITLIPFRRSGRPPGTSQMNDRSNMSTDSDVICAAYDMVRIVIRPAAYEVVVGR